MQQMVKERIGRHEVICPLGEGGMAQVYLGFSRGPAEVNKLVVLKLIRSELARDKRFVTMFLDEARLATRLNHPNVVHTYEVLEDAGQYILTMEFLEGQSLFDVFQRIDLQYFPLDVHLWILTQVLAGLQYAHALPDYNGSPLGVVHRDVSPDNTFVTYSGEVKLLDFGIAKAAGAVSVTNRGTFKGKLAYCAPEQLQDEDPPDARADIFAVGVMLWEALAGKRIEAGDTCARLAQTRLMGGEPRIRQLRPQVPAALADMCDKAMALHPTDRYLSAVDFQRDLERYLEKSEKKVGRAQLAELMRAHFESERRDIRKRIQDHLLAAAKAPVTAQKSPSYRLGPSRGSRHRMTAPGGTGPAMLGSPAAKTQALGAASTPWAPSAILPKPVVETTLPQADTAVPAAQRRLPKRIPILSVVLMAAILGAGVLGAALLGGGAAATRIAKTVAGATALRKVPLAIASPAKPAAWPQAGSSPVPVPATPAAEIVPSAPQVARAFVPARDGQPQAEPRPYRPPAQAGHRRHSRPDKRKSSHDTRAEPHAVQEVPPPPQFLAPGMDLDQPSVADTAKPIDETNPYAR